jgi:hypothetical protein
MALRGDDRTYGRMYRWYEADPTSARVACLADIAAYEAYPAWHVACILPTPRSDNEISVRSVDPSQTRLKGR